MQPSAGSSSYSSQDSPPRTELWWDRFPSLKIVRPPKGPYSPQVDERCFTYCSQSITGRIHGSDPWCRTICVRRVFSHEVSRILSHHRTQTVTHLPGRKQPLVETKDDVQTQPINHPLPPEGQRYNGWLAMLLHGRFGPGPDEDGFHQHDDPTEQDPTLTPGHAHSQRETKYWREGWYLWWSSSRWAAQEKLDLMRRDLEGQTEWQKLKDRRNDEWARGLPPYEETQGDGQAQGDLHPFEDLGNMPPFPDVSSSSLLLPLPLQSTSLPSIGAFLSRPLAPAGRVVDLVQESVNSGAQKEFWGRVWDKAQTDEPRKLLVTAWGRVMENFLGSEDERGGSNGKAPGSGAASEGGREKDDKGAKST